MKSYAKMVVERRRAKEARDELYKKAESFHEENPCMQYTLASGRRCTIDGFFDQDLCITYDHLTSFSSSIGRVSTDDLREFLEIRLMIDAWKAGDADLIMPNEPFDRWMAPARFSVTHGR